MRPPEVEWDAIVRAGKAWQQIATPRQRSLALGKAVHFKLEKYFSSGQVVWTDEPGQIAMSGLHLLPTPDECAELRIEAPIGDEPAEDGIAVMRAGGIAWRGFVDLQARVTPAGLERLGIDAGATDGWVTFDYKTTKDPRWVKSPAELAVNGQANLYAYDWLARVHADEWIGRWVYFRTQGKREAVPVDFRIDPYAASTAVHDAAERAISLDALETIDQATPNPGHCDQYGGCPYHHTRGGPCSAKRRLGALVQARVPKKEGSIEMAPWTQRIKNLPGQRPAAAAVKAAPEPPPEADETPAADEPTEEPAANVAPTNKPPWANRKLPSGAPAEPATQAGPPTAKPAKPKAAPKPKAQPSPAPVEAPADPSDPGLRMTLSIEGSPADLMALLQAISG